MAEPSRTAIAAPARELRARMAAGRAALPPGSWHAWLRTLAVGAVGMVLLMLLLKTVAQRLEGSGALAWEADFLRRLAEQLPFGFSSAVFFQTFGTDITLVILIAATAGIAAWCRRPITALSLPLAAIGADLTGRFGWMIWDRARPDVLYEGFASPGFHAFPSGHTSKTMAVYGLLVFLWLRNSRNPLEWLVGLALLVFIAIIVPVSRMAMGVHWPSDVTAGLILGLFWLGVLIYGLRYERV